MISIVIPVYKAENYLRGCIDSVLVQTYMSWELILVDDGSPDNSGKLCDEYAAKDTRIRVIHKGNEGVGAARNAAIEIARGEKLCFIDADDTVEPDYLECLCSHPESDMVVCGYFVDRYDSKGTLISSERHCPQEQIVNGSQDRYLIKEAFMSGVMHINCNKLFDVSIIREHNIRYKHYPVNEDFIFIMEYLLKTKSISIIPHSLYHWVRIDGILSGVESIPSDILQIYELSHTLMFQYFDNQAIADQIAYRSYDLIIYKYLHLNRIGKIKKEMCFNLLANLHNSKLVKRAFDAYSPTAPVEKILYNLNKLGLFKTTNFVLNLIACIK